MRFPDEIDEAFRGRATKAAEIGRVLVAACFNNHRVRELIECGELSDRKLRACPIVRVEFEQAIAIGGIGETLDATKSKHWGAGPWIMPLQPDDNFYFGFITYLYRPNSLYNRRFEQRMRMKQLLGPNRKLVGEAKQSTKGLFLQMLTWDQAKAIRRCLKIEPGKFWRAAQGKLFLDLPKRPVQLTFDFERIAELEENDAGVPGGMEQG